LVGCFLFLINHLREYRILIVKPAIVVTATRLFAAQGYEATTTLQIAREVGVTEPAVFYYFKNKNHCLPPSSKRRRRSISNASMHWILTAVSPSAALRP
jgi:predicted transcriptional regulator